MTNILLSYTRTPIDNVLYDPRLAYSMHLALAGEDGQFAPLNHNSGVLFARATENEDGSLNPKSILCPFVFSAKDGSYGVIAVRIMGDGEADEESRGSAILFATRDFIDYEELGLIALDSQTIEAVCCNYIEGEDRYRLWWRTGGNWHSGYTADIRSLRLEERAEDEAGPAAFPASVETVGFDREACAQIEGIVPCSALRITDGEADYLKKKLLTPVNLSVDVPEAVEAADRETLIAALESCCARAHYSDGTTVEKRVEWEIPDIDFTKKGSFPVRGRVRRMHFPFPVAYNRADPCVCLWKGRYYFIATNDADGNHTLYIREASTLEGLADAEETLILDSSTYPEIGGLLWAPEFHEIDGRLYIFHAATTGEFFWEESCLMELREGGNPACRTDWSRPRRIVRKDGSELCKAGEVITLDMTCFLWEGSYYVVWSQRQFLPKDLGAWLYIAKLDPKEPWRLLTDPVLLSKPDYGWGNNHTFVEEGPYALMRGDMLYLTFSAAAVDTSYVVGLLSIGRGMDLLVRENWHKKNYPILTSRSVEGEYGTGHNAYVTDEEGVVWNTYHARPGTEGVRSSGIRRVHFDADGEPRLDVTEELDVRDALIEVETTVVVR